MELREERATEKKARVLPRCVCPHSPAAAWRSPHAVSISPSLATLRFPSYIFKY